MKRNGAPVSLFLIEQPFEGFPALDDRSGPDIEGQLLSTDTAIAERPMEAEEQIELLDDAFFFT